MEISDWYFEKLAVLADESEFEEFFEKNYLEDERTGKKIYWCDGHISFTSKDELHELVEEIWKSSRKQKVIKDLKER